MKTLMVTISTLLLATAPQPAFTADIDEVIENYLSAIGGREVLDAVRTELSSGEFDVMGMHGEMTVYLNKTDRILAVNVESVDGDNRSVMMREYLTDEKGFIFMMGEVVEYDEMNIDSRKKKIFDENYLQLCMNYKALGFTAEMKTDETEFGDIHRITFSKDGTAKMMLSFDSHSYLLINSEDYDLNSSIAFSDYKKNEPTGLMKPYTIKQKLSGLTIDIRINEYLFNVEEPQGLSEIPEF